MFRNKNLEMKVGLFIGVGIFLMFLIVFSISDIYLLRKGLDVHILFDYVNGLTENAPVRLAGVEIGEVRQLEIIYDREKERTRVKVTVWLSGDAPVSKDSVARINTLGLLGEQYLEITPGVSEELVTQDETIDGKTPVNMGVQMEGMRDLIKTFKDIMDRAGKGEGTLGKLMTDDALYDNISGVFGRINSGEGTVGRLITDDTIYNDLEAFVKDIKAHPWKLLSKPRRSKRDKEDKKDK